MLYIIRTENIQSVIGKNESLNVETDIWGFSLFFYMVS